MLLRGDALDLPARLAAVPGWDGARPRLIYVDPPYDTGGHFTERRGKGGARRKAGPSHPDVAYADAWGGRDAFAAMLEARLVALRDWLADDGAIVVHLSPEVAHDAKFALDRTFGRGAYAGEIVWVPGNGARGHGVPATHQTLLIYGRGRVRWNGDDPDLREPYAETSRAMHFTKIDPEGRRFRERVIGGKAYRYYEDEGRLRGSVWLDLPAMVANTPLRKEATGYPTQKPLALLERIVRALTRPGDLVADPMCGSGTTLEAAHRLGRRFVGNDRGEAAIRISRERLGNADCYVGA